MINAAKSFRPVRSVSKVQHAFSELRDYILKGSLPPGTELPPESHMARQLGVSKVCVREALSMAQAQGLIDVVRGRRSRVAKPSTALAAEMMGFTLRYSADDFLQLVEARQCLEAQIARLAATRATPAQVQALADVIAAMENAPHNMDFCAEQDLKFHNILVDASDNKVFKIMMAPLSELLHEARTRTMQLYGVPRASTGHREILDAITRGQPDRAEKAMNEHLQMAEEDLREITRP